MPFLLASLGGSTIFTIGLTRSPATQPRTRFGGYLGGVFNGIASNLASGSSGDNLSRRYRRHPEPYIRAES